MSILAMEVNLKTYKNNGFIYTNHLWIDDAMGRNPNLEILQNIICLEIDFSVFTTTKNHDFQTRCSKKKLSTLLSSLFFLTHTSPDMRKMKS